MCNDFGAQVKFDAVYYDWNVKRVTAMVEYYGAEFFVGLKILEVGCGYGDIGHMFQQMGADVTFLDARQDHLDHIKERGPNNWTILMNLDEEWPDAEWDMVIHFGVLYHLENPRDCLRKACASTKYMVLETEVVDSDNPDFAKERGEPDHYTQSMSRKGVRLSPPGVEKILKECSMKFERLWDDKLNTGIHRYGWESKNDKSCSPGLRRFWFCEKIDEIQD